MKHRYNTIEHPPLDTSDVVYARKKAGMYSRVPNEQARHPKYIDEEGNIRTAILWKYWAAQKMGYVAENMINKGIGEFVIYDSLNNKIVKTLTEVK